MVSSTVYRALVTYSSTSTGEIRVKIPSLIGVSDEVPISYIGRSSSNDYWAVPKIGDQIVVTSDDENLTNVFWVQTEPFNPGTKEPTGFSNRLDSTISFDNATRTFTLSPVDNQFEVWVRGVKYEIKDPVSLVIPNTHGGHNIYFDAAGELQTKTTFFDLEWEAPVAYIYWNTTSAIYLADERHGTTLDWATHEYLHRTQGAQFSSGFEVSGYTTTGTGNTVADAKISIANGTFFDEDLEINITHAATPVLNTWQQRLQNGAYIPIFYKTGSGWQKTTATQYPMQFGTTYPQYNATATSLVEMGNNRYGISWIVATNNLNEPIIAIMGQQEYSNINDAQSALWSNITITGFPSFEFRPLWKIIFQAQNGSAVKAAIRAVDDLRTFKGSAASGGTSVTALDNLVDVTLTSPQVSQTIVYTGSQWVNSYPAVLTFDNASARSSAITSPSVGTFTYLKDVASMEFFDGTNWSRLGTPAGTISPFAGTTTPDGWFLCDGRLLVRETYPSLFSSIGTLYNTGGETSLQFRVPDLRGRVVAGVDNMGTNPRANRLTSTVITGDAITLGNSGGSQTHTLSETQMPSHNHPQNPHSHAVIARGTLGADRYLYGDYIGGPGSTHLNPNTIGTITGSAFSNPAEAISVTATNQSVGGGQAHNNTQPTMVLNYIIKS